MSSVADTLLSILFFLLIFCIVVISHEFGHFIIAKANGIHVVEFYVGFGPTLVHWTKGGTKYSIKLLPLGGACVFEGMDAAAEKAEAKDSGESSDDEYATEPPETVVSAAMDSDGVSEPKVTADKTSEDKGSFIKASPWSRFATLFAGPLFNFILGIIIAFIMVNLIAIRDPIATEVIPGGAAEAAGLQPGDRIISLNGQRVCLYEDIVLFNALYEGGEVKLVYERDGQRYNTVLTPQYYAEEDRFLLGISNADFIELKGLDSIKYTFYELRYNVKMTYGSLWKLIRGKVKSTQVAGPVGIAVNVVGQTYESVKEYGAGTVFVNMLNIALMLTINLGILNLLPIPALDGGRLLFVIIELLRGKPVPPEKEAIVHFIGVIFFIVLIVLVFFNDIRNVFFIK